MFTGIVEEVSKIISKIQKDGFIEFTAECNLINQDMKIGDSISVNGCCQTVTKFTPNSFSFESYKETLEKTNLSFLELNSFVNLERALAFNSRLGGHLVSGHIEGMVKIISLTKNDDNTYLSIELKKELKKYVIKEGSITLDGISLTIANLEDNLLSVNIINHTLENTNLKYKKIGDFLNVESDLIAKYVENLIKEKQLI